MPATGGGPGPAQARVGAVPNAATVDSFPSGFTAPALPPTYSGFTIPNIESAPTYDGQSQPDYTDFQSLVMASGGQGVIGLPNSFEVTPVFNAPSMAVNVAPGGGYVPSAGAVFSLNPVTLTIPTATGGDRVDIVVYDATGYPNHTGITLIRGQENIGVAGSVWTRLNNYGPVKPTLTAQQILVAAIYVPYNATQIVAGNIVDRRVPVDKPDAILGSSYYAPCAPRVYTFSGGTQPNTALDNGNATVQFTAPASGRVRVEEQAYGNVPTAANVSMQFGIFNHLTNARVPGTGWVCVVTDSVNGTASGIPLIANQYVAGLVPGQRYWWDLAITGTNGSQVYTVVAQVQTVDFGQRDVGAGNPGGPIIMRVLAA